MKHYFTVIFLALCFCARAQQDTSVHIIVQQMPKFNGDLAQYLGDHLIYPANASRSGTVMLSFVIEKDGSISRIRVTNSVEKPLDSIAMDCVANMPKWIPGILNKQPVRVLYNMPLNFSAPVIELKSQNPTVAPRVK